MHSPISRDAALLSLRMDGGTQEIVPFLVRLVSHNVGNAMKCSAATLSSSSSKKNKANANNINSSSNGGTTNTNGIILDKLDAMIGLARAMTANSRLHLGLHLQQLLPPILTCALARRLGCSSSNNNSNNNSSSNSNSNSNSNSDSNNNGNNAYHGGDNHDNDHWTLRCTSATAAAEIADRYGMEYTSLRGRLLVPFSEALLKELQPLPPAKIRTQTTTNNNTAAAATTTQAGSQVNPKNNTMAAIAATATAVAATTTTTTTRLATTPTVSRLGTVYGGLVGMSRFGSMAVDSFVLPIAKVYWEKWTVELEGVRRMGACGKNGNLYTNLEQDCDVDDDGDNNNKGGTVAMVVDEKEKKNSTEVGKDDKMNIDNDKKDSDAMEVDVVSLPTKDNKIEGIKNDGNATVTNNTVSPIVPSTTTTATSKVSSSTTAASASLDGKHIKTNTTTTTTSTTTNTNTNIKSKGALSITTDNDNNGVTIDPIRRYEIQRCKEAMLEALGTFLLDEESNGSATAAGGIGIGGMGMDDTTTTSGGGCGDNTQNGNGGGNGNGNGNGGRHNSFGRGLKGWNDLEDVFGECLVPFVRPRSYGRHADYLSCFL